MIDLVTASNAHLYKDALTQMYQRRHDVFVKRRGWTALDHGDGLEKDQFDTEHAIYLLSIRDDGIVDGGLRLLETTGPHLLGDLFPHFVDGAVPRGPGVYEMTRYFVIRGGEQRKKRRWVAGELLCAMFEYCLAQKAEWITTMLDAFYIKRMRENNWNEELLGPQTPYDEGMGVAAKFAVTEQNLKATQLAHFVFWPTLRHVTSLPVARTATLLPVEEPIRLTA